MLWQMMLRRFENYHQRCYCSRSWVCRVSALEDSSPNESESFNAHVCPFPVISQCRLSFRVNHACFVTDYFCKIMIFQLFFLICGCSST